MSRAIALEILSHPNVRARIGVGKTLEYCATRAVAYAEAFTELTAGEPDEVVMFVRADLPMVFATNFSRNYSALQAVSNAVDNARKMVESLDLGEESYARHNQEAADAKAKAEQDAIDQLAREQVEADRVKAKADAERARKQKEAEGARKAEADKVAAREKARSDADREKKALAAEEARKRDEARLESAKEATDETISSQELEDMLLTDSPLADGIVNDLAKVGIKTVGNLLLYGETQNGDFTEVDGVGPVSNREIIEVLANLKSRAEG